jgi:hypothetical protein
MKAASKSFATSCIREPVQRTGKLVALDEGTLNILLSFGQ